MNAKFTLAGLTFQGQIKDVNKTKIVLLFQHYIILFSA